MVGLAMANPVPWPATPSLDKPAITIDSPKNNTAYNDGDLYLNCTVTKPESWDKNNLMNIPYMGQIASVDAYLDGNRISLDGNNFNFALGNPVGNYSAVLNLSGSALHEVNVTVLWHAYYRGPAYNGSHILSSIDSNGDPVYQYPQVVSDIVYFTAVEEASSSPTWLPTINAGAEPAQAEPFSTTLATIVIVAVIGAGLLVYFKKHQ
jgi:hypothetical protein